VGEFCSSRLFLPCLLKFRESVQESGYAGFMVFIVKPSPVPYLERRFHQKVKEATKGTSLKSNTSNNVLVTSAWLVFQEEVVLK
jgi:hypothetical protein